jgi:pimeloyl-ACP methyl ester carboxylesterase
MPSSYLFLNGLRLHYLYWNLEGDGCPVVLLHGLASNARIWERVAPYLSKSGLTSYSPDLRGHGLSDKPDGDYGFTTFRQDLQAILDGLNCERPVLVGHSWGALLALDYAARFAVGPRAGRHRAGGWRRFPAGPDPRCNLGENSPAPDPADLAGMPQESSGRFRPLEQFLGPAGKPPTMLANFEVGEDETISPHLTFEHHMQIPRSIWEFQTFGASLVRCPARHPAVPSAFQASRNLTARQNRKAPNRLARSSRTRDLLDGRYDPRHTPAAPGRAGRADRRSPSGSINP